MGWKSEKEFVDNFVDTLRNRCESAHVIREFRTGYGLPDVVWIEYSKDVIRKRRRKVRRRALAPFTVDCAYTMAYLSRRRWVKVATLKSVFGSYNGPLRDTVETLTARKLIRRTSDKVKAVPKPEIFAIEAITIIEAKLRNWRRAIMQAQKYLWVTDNCYLLVPESRRVRQSQMVATCRKYRVGLAIFSKDGTINQVIDLRKRRPYNTYLAWMLNENLFDEMRNG